MSDEERLLFYKQQLRKLRTHKGTYWETSELCLHDHDPRDAEEMVGREIEMGLSFEEGMEYLKTRRCMTCRRVEWAKAFEQAAERMERRRMP